MLQLIMRSFVLVGVLFWYSVGVWKIIDTYFRAEMKKDLDAKYKMNKYLKPEVMEQLEKQYLEKSLPAPDSTVEQLAKGTVLMGEDFQYKENLVLKEMPQEFCPVSKQLTRFYEIINSYNKQCAKEDFVINS